jgi:hypothetical protein
MFIKCTNPKYIQYDKKLDKFFKKYKLNSNSLNDIEKFGRASSNFVNKKKCHNKKYTENIREYLLVFFKIVTLLLLLFSIILSFIQHDDDVKKEVNNIQEICETVFMIFCGIVLIIIFWPSFPKQIIAPIDILFAFTAGVLLIINVVTKLFIKK